MSEIIGELTATDGRFLMPEGKDDLPLAESVLGQLDGLLDLTGCGELIANIRKLTVKLQRTRLEPRLTANFETALLESVDELGKCIDKHEGISVITVDANLESSRSPEGRLFKDYGICADDDIGSMLVVPAGKITASQANTNLVSGTTYEPVLNIRIQSSSDSHITRMGENGALVQDVSPGRWYKFPIKTTDLSLLELIG